MASKFTAGMTNVVQVLNEMWDKFAAGPYNALPLTGGTLTGPVVSTSRVSVVDLVASTRVLAGATTFSEIASSVRAPNDGQPGVANTYYEVGAYGVASVGSSVWGGKFFWSTCGGFGSSLSAGYKMNLRAYDASAQTPSATLLEVNGLGDLAVARFLTAGPVAAASKHQAYRNIAEAGEIFHVARSGTWPCVGINGSSGLGGWGAGASVMYVGRNSVTGRSISAAGTINASGADYAEYLIKALLCGTIVPGQIVGIDADGRLTDKWDRAIAFMVKSTDPCMVGGDRWGQHLGPRPDAVEPIQGETDEEWAARQAPGTAFDAALEAARQTVDRIAFAGQVPVNVLGATPGQYIVPVQEGEGIAGQAVDRGDMTLDQYMSAIGRVIAIEKDGRARIIVKVA